MWEWEWWKWWSGYGSVRGRGGGGEGDYVLGVGVVYQRYMDFRNPETVVRPQLGVWICVRGCSALGESVERVWVCGRGAVRQRYYRFQY